MLACYVNVSSQRRDHYTDLQYKFPLAQVAERPRSPRLHLIQDIKVHSYLICLMLIRSLQFCNTIKAYHSETEMSPILRSLPLKSDELKLVEYLLVLTYSFAIKGYTICAESHPTIHLVWDTFTSPFQHPKDRIVFLQ